MGKVVGYRAGISRLSGDARLIVSADEERIVITMDPRQVKFVEGRYPRGSAIPVEYYGGKWHIGNDARAQDIARYDPFVSAWEVIDAIRKGVAE